MLLRRLPVTDGGTGSALALPFADTEAMQLHLNEIARAGTKGSHAVLLLDRAGWHTTAALAVPSNITIAARRARPRARIWRKSRRLSGRRSRACSRASSVR